MYITDEYLRRCSREPLSLFYDLNFYGRKGITLNGIYTDWQGILGHKIHDISSIFILELLLSSS